jgi:hypothetical protein
MEHKIINTENYLLIVDDSEIKKETYCYDSINNILVFYKGSMKNIGFQKVISHLPLNNSPILEGVDLLPPLGVDVEKIAKQEAEKLHHKGKHDDWDIYNQLVYEDTEMIKIGYNKAKEKYKYTEEDIKKAFRAGFIQRNEAKPNSCDNLIQSLQQPKMPVGFKCEIEKPSSSFGAHMANFFGQSIPKTTTNSQGLTQLVGEYIY